MSRSDLTTEQALRVSKSSKATREVVETLQRRIRALEGDLAAIEAMSAQDTSGLVSVHIGDAFEGTKLTLADKSRVQFLVRGSTVEVALGGAGDGYLSIRGAHEGLQVKPVVGNEIHVRVQKRGEGWG